VWFLKLTSDNQLRKAIKLTSGMSERAPDARAQPGSPSAVAVGHPN
jgi:hypothetical protein